MKRKGLNTILLVVVLLVLSINLVSATWWNTSWSKRQEINITNTGSLQTNYQIKVILTYDNDMKSDFGDLRFLNSSNDGILDFWLQDVINDTSAIVWVNVDSLSGGANTSIYMYYGNSGASSSSNGSATFLLFDDFNDGIINGNLWTKVDNGNKFTESNGKLVVSGEGGSWTHAMYSTQSFDRSNLSFEFDYWWRSDNPSYDALMMGWKDNSSGASFSNLVYAYYNPGSGGGTTISQYIYEDGHGRGSTGYNWVMNDSYDVRVRMKSGSGAFYGYSINNGTAWTNAYDSSYSSESALHVGWSYHSGVHEFDNVRVRKWMSNEPTSVFGPEENADTTPPLVNLNSPVDEYNTSSQELIFNFTATDNFLNDMNCSLYIDSVLQMSNSTVQNNTLTNLNASGITKGIHSWNVTCLDESSNSNTSSSRNFYVDLTPPDISSVFYSPNSSGDVDPGANLTFNVTVVDDRIGVDSVVLEYYNGTNWANKSMNYLGGNEYNVSLSLVGTNQTYIFNIWANDSFGNSNVSVNQTFDSVWDCTWTLTPDLGQVIGFDENKFIGNITLNNTGDVQYVNNNCSLDFKLTYDLSEGRIYYEGEYFKNLPLPSGTISAGMSKNININATFQNEVLEEDAVITLDEFRGRSNQFYKNTTVTLVSTPGGPYLFETISSYPSSLDLTFKNFSLSAYIRNLAGDDTTNNTAYNISFNWTLPSNFLVKDGLAKINYENLSNNSLIYNDINLTFNDTNLPNLSPGIITVYLYAQGKNSSGDIIEHAGNVSILSKQINISLNCYDISDGVYVSACGDLDPDKPANDLSSSASSGGGGGSSGSNIEFIKTNSNFQLVRGKENEVIILFNNPDKNDSITNIKFSVEGKISKYVKLFPTSFGSLKPGQKINVTLRITSPTYIELGKQELIVTMTGKKGIREFTNKKIVVLEIHELSGNQARELIKKFEKIVKEYHSATICKGINCSSLLPKNLIISFQDTFEKSEEAMKMFDYEAVRDNYKIVSERINNALNAKKIFNEVDTLVIAAKEKRIDVSGTERILRLVKLSLKRGDFAQGILRAKEAQATFALETKGEFGSISYYLNNNKKEISFIFTLFTLFGFTSYRVGKLYALKKKIKKLKEEEGILAELMKVVQRETFENKKMSMDEYNESMKQYENRMSKTIEKLIELETQRAYALRFVSKGKKLKNEKEKIIDLVKNLQRDYLQLGVMESKSYKFRLESYNKRLADIDQKLVTLEAKSAIRMSKIRLFNRRMRPWKKS